MEAVVYVGDRRRVLLSIAVAPCGVGRAEIVTVFVSKRSSRSEPSGDRFGPAHPLTFAEVEQATDPPPRAGKQRRRLRQVGGSVTPGAAAQRSDGGVTAPSYMEQSAEVRGIDLRLSGRTMRRPFGVY
jgi:hypothetical protein